MDGMFDRFKPELKGGHFANTYWNKSTFEKKVSIPILISYLFLNYQQFHFPIEPKKEDLPKGRPLFLREINKDVPPPDTYDVKRNADILPINPKKPC